jgi:CDP-glycerol glycerophosphotransferase (TagB/SpsB family)
MIRLLRRLAATIVRLGFAMGRRTRLRRRVVLATNRADRLSGNLAAIRDELAAAHPEIPIVILARRGTPGWRGNLRGLLDLAIAGWHLATARLFVIDDHYFPMYVVPRRPATRYVQVWHACGAFKKFGYSLADKSFGADGASLAAVPMHTNYDLCLVSAMRFAPFYAEAFRAPIDRFSSAYGIPRTDVLTDPARRPAIEAAIRERYRIPAGLRVVLYAPTFRGERTTDARFPGGLDLAELRAALGVDHVLLVRAHPFVLLGGVPRHAELDGFAIDVSDYPELNELMLVSDVLVTDYSSAIYEFALLSRPIAFFMPDRAAYDEERGFYLDLSRDLPGPAFETTAELGAFLRAGFFDLERVRQFAAESFDVADGQATQRFVEEVVLYALA